MSVQAITMNQSSGFAALLAKPQTLLRQSWAFNRMSTLGTLLSWAMIPLVLLALWLDPVTITGVNGWVKPLKFLISTAIYIPTLTWLLMQVHGWRRFVQFTAWFVGAALLVEHALIIIQVVRRTTSHFNVGTPFDSAVFSTMGLLIMIVSVLNLLVAIRLIFQKLDNRVLAWGLRLGLIATVLGMWVAMLMTSPTAAQLQQAQATGAMPYAGAHSVGVADGGPGLPLVGWSTTGGDLRIPHFVGLHALQVIPLAGWLLTRRAATRRWREGQRLVLVWTVGLGYMGLMALLTWQALRGQSIIAPDGLTLAGVAGLLLAMALPATVTLFANRPTNQLGEVQPA